MKRRLVLIIGISLIAIRISAQPLETTYLGNVAVSGYADDESYGPYNIGFNFTFYGNIYNQFYINSNGQLLFGAGSFLSGAKAIPTADEPNNFIAAFWDDLVVDSYGKILYTTIGAAPNRKLIVQFTNMGFYPFPANLGTFSVILYETTNRIQVQYRVIVLSSSAKAHGGQAAIGLENETGLAGVQYAFLNPTAVNSEQAISFSPVAGPSYSTNPAAVYDGVYLTTNLTLPEPGIPTLISPPLDAAIGSAYTFEWGSASNAASYTLYLSTDPELIGAVAYPAGSNLTYNITGLTLDQTYYWGVFSKNATGTTWCEIKKFTTSSTPPLVPVPQTVWTEQYTDKTIKLNYTGGDAGLKTAIITTLPGPGNGQLYQYNGGVRGNIISSVPTTLTDVNRNVIYSASGGSGNSAGNFSFKISETSGVSPEGLITINVSPPGIPNVLYFAISSNYIEIQFDIPISVPSGNESQFIVTAEGSVVNVSSVTVKTGDPYTIILNLATQIQLTDNILVSYSPGYIAGFTGGLLLPFTDEPVTLLAQTINFSQSLARNYSDSPFAFSATSSSGLGMTYSSSNLSVATIISNIATFRALGNSDITVRQTGNATFAPAKYLKTLTVSAGDQTIAFNPISTRNVGDGDFSPGATSTSGLVVSYSSSNTAVATIVSGMIHIVSGGTSVITASQSGNALFNAATPAQQTLTVVDAASKTLNLTVFLEGLFNGINGLVKVQGCIDGESSFDMFTGTISDTLTIQLAQTVAPYLIVYTMHGVPINTNGTLILNNIPAALSGNYHIVIKHRNHIETWSQSISFGASNINYNFTSGISQAWADNMIRVGSLYCIYTGDTNKDQYVDGFDLAIVFNLNRSGSFGYQLSDINGDGFIDGFDLAKVFNNNKKGVGMNTPAAPLE